MNDQRSQDLRSPLRLAQLPATTRALIRDRDYDKFEEKHEGPWSWEYLISADDEIGADDEPTLTGEPAPERAEFLRIEGRDALLPVGEDHHPYLSVERVIVSADDRHLVIFLTDITYDALYPHYKHIFNDFMALCVKLPGEDFYVAAVYHQWLPTALD